MILKELPSLERPREKAFKFGFSKLSNSEVLALLLGSGTKGKSVIELSYEILNKFNHSIDFLLHFKEKTLASIVSVFSF